MNKKLIFEDPNVNNELTSLNYFKKIGFCVAKFNIIEDFQSEVENKMVSFLNDVEKNDKVYIVFEFYPCKEHGINKKMNFFFEKLCKKFIRSYKKYKFNFISNETSMDTRNGKMKNVNIPKQRIIFCSLIENFNCKKFLSDFLPLTYRVSVGDDYDFSIISEKADKKLICLNRGAVFKIYDTR